MNPSNFHPLRFAFSLVRCLDPVLLLALGALLGASYVLMHSASPERLPTLVNNAIVALGVMWVVARVPPKHLFRFAVPLYLLGLLLLVGVAMFGEMSKGARRWLDIGVTRIQPSELMKIAMPLMLAWYFQLREGAVRFYDFIVALVLLGIPAGFILVQPDLGTSLLVIAAGGFVIYFAGLSWKLILPCMLVGLLGIGALLVFGEQWCEPGVDWQVLKEYQKNRVCTLLDPSKDPLGKGFHTIQSSIAIGSGGVWGKGWLAGTQTHLAFIPERHTDFIFAVLAEEFGFVGAIGLLLAYLLMILRGLSIAARAPSEGTRLLAGALTLVIFTYAFVNLGMVSGILPVVGVPLPFISYGGTALVTLCLGLGILMSIRRSTQVLRERAQSESL